MYKFLLIEDSESDAQAFSDTIKRLNLEKDDEDMFNLEVAETFDKGIEMISSNYNGVIIDIKLDDDHDGNEIISKILKKYRLPIVVFTGTPDVNIDNELPISVFIKGVHTHESIINELCEISDTGIYNVLSGTGIIEEIMTQIFWKNLYPQMKVWKEKKGQGIDTEKILLRYTISHIQELIDNDIPSYVTEEMYIKPPISNVIKTGDIYQEQLRKEYYIVLSPPCDLAVHNGKIKTDRILVCEIEEQDNINKLLIKTGKNADKKRDSIYNCLNNNYTNYYHWLPGNSLFSGGYINFRKVITYEPEDFRNRFGCAKLKVQDYFVKSIMNRFSSYYARQGQPDFDLKQEAKVIYERMTNLIDIGSGFDSEDKRGMNLRKK